MGSGVIIFIVVVGVIAAILLIVKLSQAQAERDAQFFEVAHVIVDRKERRVGRE